MKEINRRVYEYNKKVIAEDDHITLYGLVKGRQSYETVFKATKTLPYMIAYMYDNWYLTKRLILNKYFITQLLIQT